MGVRNSARLLYLGVREIPTETDVLPDGTGEKTRLLRNDTNHLESMDVEGEHTYENKIALKMFSENLKIRRIVISN